MENIIRKIKQIYPGFRRSTSSASGEYGIKVLSQRYPYRSVRCHRPSGLFYWRGYHPFRIPPQRRGHHYVVQSGGRRTFGMDSLYYQQPSVESVETLSDCKIYVIHIDKLNALYETYIDIANWGRILHQNVNKELSHMFVERLQLFAQRTLRTVQPSLSRTDKPSETEICGCLSGHFHLYP